MPFNITSTGGGPPLNGRVKIHLGSFFRWLRHNFSSPSKLTFSQFVEKIVKEFSFDLEDVATRALLLFAWAVVTGRTRKSPYGTAWYVTEDEDGLRFYLFSKPSDGLKPTEEKVKKLSNLDPDKVFHGRCLRCNAQMPIVGMAANHPALRGYLFLECGVPGVERVDMAKLEVLVNRAWETTLKGGYHEKEREPVKK